MYIERSLDELNNWVRGVEAEKRWKMFGIRIEMHSMGGKKPSKTGKNYPLETKK